MASMDEFSILPLEPQSEDYGQRLSHFAHTVSSSVSHPSLGTQSVESGPLYRAPPLSALRPLLGGLLRGERDPQDQWEYAVSARWLDTLRASLELQEKSGTAAGAAGSSSMTGSDASISASASTSRNGNGSHQVSSKSGIPPMFLDSPTGSLSNEKAGLHYVGEGLWLKLLLWFGAARNFRLLRRPIHCTYVNVSSPGSTTAHLLTDNKADCLSVGVGLLLEHSSDPTPTPNITCFLWDHLHFVLLQVRQVLGLPSAAPVRLWCQLWESGSSLFLQEVGERDGVSLGHFLCSRHAPLVRALTERQQLPAEDEQNGARGSIHSFSSPRCPLDDLFAQHKWSVALWVEEYPPFLQPPSASHAHSPSILTSHGHVDPAALGSLLDWAPRSGCAAWDVQLSESLRQFRLSVDRSWDSVRDASVHSAQQVVRSKMIQIDLRERRVTAREATVKEREVKATKLEEELSVRQMELNHKTTKFKAALTDFLVQKNRLEEELRKIEATNHIADSKITLNVGGTVYSTSTITLQKEKDSLLAVMFSGRHKLQRQPDGSIFIDRDGTHFRYLLNFLRDGERALDSLPANARLLSHLIAEAEYFQLSRLVTLLKARLADGQNTAGFQSL